MDDPYDCMLPDDYVESMRADTPEPKMNLQLRMFAYERCTYFLNCWHLSAHESAAMWKLYAGVDAGIALKLVATPSIAGPSGGGVHPLA